MAWDDQRYGVGCHCLSNISRSLRFRAQGLGYRTVGGRLTPTQFPDLSIDLREEGILQSEIDRHTGKVDPLTVEVTHDIADETGDRCGGDGALCQGQAPTDRHLGRLLGLRGQPQAAHTVLVPGNGDEAVLGLERRIFRLVSHAPRSKDHYSGAQESGEFTLRFALPPTRQGAVRARWYGHDTVSAQREPTVERG